MFCQNCGNVIPEGTKFCMNCGTPVFVPETAVNAPAVAETPAPADGIQTPYASAPAMPETPVVPEAPAVPAAPVIPEAPVQYAQPVQPAYPTEPAQPQYAQPQYEQQQYGQYAQPQYYAAPAPEKKPKKEKKPVSKKTKIKRILFVSIPALVLAAVVVFNFSFLKGWAIKTFGSGEDYMGYVEESSLKNTVGTATGLYGTAIKTGFKTFSESDVTFELKADFSDKFYSLVGGKLSDELGTDLSWLKNADVVFNLSPDSDKLGLSVTASINGKSALSGSVIADIENKKVYVNVPELFNKYLAVDLNSLLYGTNNGSYGDYGMGSEYSDVLGYLSLFKDHDLSKILPGEEELNRIIDRYIGIICDDLDDAEKKSGKLSAGGITEKCTVLTTEISEATVLKMAKDVVKEAKDDDDIRNIIRRVVESDEFSEIAEKAFGLSAGDIPDGSEINLLWKNLLKNAYEELCDVEDPDTEPIVTIVDYVNKSHEIIGRRIIVDDEEFYYGCAKKGSKFGFEAGLLGKAKVEGSGTYDGDVYTGEFSLEVGDDELLEFRLKNFNMESLRSGKLDGTVEIPVMPVADLFGIFGRSERDALELLDPWVSVTFKTEENRSEAGIDITVKGESLVKLSLSAGTSKSTPVKLPDDYIVVDGNTGLEDLPAGTLDYEKFFKNLKDCGIPTELVDELEDSVKDELEPEDPYAPYESYEEIYLNESEGLGF